MSLKKNLEPIERNSKFKQVIKSNIVLIEELIESGKDASQKIEEFNKLTGRDYDVHYFINYWESMSIDEFVDEACNPIPKKINNITKEELIEIVRRVQDVENYKEYNTYYTELLTANVVMPDILNLIYYTELSPEEIIEKAISYKPIVL